WAPTVLPCDAASCPASNAWIGTSCRARSFGRRVSAASCRQRRRAAFRFLRGPVLLPRGPSGSRRPALPVVGGPNLDKLKSPASRAVPTRGVKGPLLDRQRAG